MENLLLALLPRERHPVILRYGATAAIVGLAFLLRLTLERQLGHYPYILFTPAVFLCALIFDRGSGFFATGLSTLLAVYFLIEPRESFAIPLDEIAPTLIFIATCCLITFVTETLRQTVERLATAEREKTLRLEELAHRTKNDLNMVTSLLSLQARRHPDKDCGAALDAAIARIQVIARAQDRLNGAQDGGVVEVAAYITALCNDLGNMLRDVRPIIVRVEAERMTMSASHAASIELVVNELVTNALKYAYPDDRGGVVEVILRRQGRVLTVQVADDGVGCPDAAPEGLGTRLVRLLVRQLKGSLARASTSGGCTVTAEIPLPA
jgi:two-component sensor histidine kinase